MGRSMGHAQLSMVFIRASFALSVLIAGNALGADKPLPAAAASADFMRDVRPILESRCVGCHGPEKQKGKLRVDTREALLKGGENGPALVAGKGAHSALVKMTARVVPDMEMPPDDDEALTPAQV